MGKIQSVFRSLYTVLKYLGWAIITVSALVSIVLLALDAAGITESALPPYAWVAIIGTTFFTAAAAYLIRSRRENQKLIKENTDLTKRLHQITSSLPNIELYGKPYVDERTIYRLKSSSDIVVSPPKPYFTHVKFRNNPQVRSADARAKDVIAELTFFDSEGKNEILNPFKGRWGDTIQPSHLERGIPTRELYSVDFEESGNDHELDIALKYRDEEVCYAYNNESYSAPGWKEPKFVLHGERFQVCVRLMGQMVDKEWWFTLCNLGMNQGLKIEVSKEAVDWQAASTGELG